MNDEATPSRAGSGADLSRRVERLEGQMSTLSTAVDRVEMKQGFAAELITEKFRNMDTAVAAQTALLANFIKRVEGMVTGEVRLPNQEAQLADWTKFREQVVADIAALKTQNVRQGGINTGIGATFGQGKAIIITLASVIGMLAAIANALHIIK